MAEKKTTTKKDPAEKKTAATKRAPRKSTKKAEIIEEIQEESATAEEAPKYETVTVKIGVVIPDEGLKIRSGPGTKFDKIGKLKKNDKVEILEEKNDFVRIGYGQWCMKCHIGGI